MKPEMGLHHLRHRNADRDYTEFSNAGAVPNYYCTEHIPALI